MVRYEKGHKSETRQRVVKRASERFCKDGIDGTGIATLMGDAGLTHGGFYAHFKSKEALVREAVRYAFVRLPSPFAGVDTPQAELSTFIDWYLSPEHRDRPAKGCPLAALGPDIARRSKSARASFMKDAELTIESIAKGLGSDVPEGDRPATAMAMLSQLVGGLQLARCIPDRRASDHLLEVGKRSARQLAMLDSMPVVTSSRAKKTAARDVKRS